MPKSLQEMPLSQKVALSRTELRFHIPVHAQEIAKAASNEKQAMLQSALIDSGRGELKRIHVEVGDGVVTLQGHVSSFYLKQLAQELIRPFAIGLQIKNQLHVT